RSNRRSAAHRHFLMLCVSIALWLSATSIALCATDAETALNWFKLDNVGVMYISVAFYGFSAEFLELQRRRSIRIGYGLATLMAGAVLFRQDFVQGVNRFWWGYFPQWGPASVPFFLIFFSYMAVAFTDYFKTYRAVTTPIKRQQIKFVLTAFVIAYLGSVDFLPAFGYELYPFGYIPIFLLTAVITVAILRYRLLDAALVVSRSAMYLPLIPFTLLVIFLGHALEDLPPVTLALLLAITTVAFAMLYVTFQPRLQSLINKAFFPSRYDAYDTLTRFGHAMVMNLDLANLQTEIVGTLQRVMGIEKISLFVFDKEKGCYLVKSSRGIAEDQAAPVRLTNDERFSNYLLECNQPIVKEELQQHPPGLDEQLAASLIETLTRMDSEVCLPLVNKTRLIGFVNLGHKPSLEFYSHDELNLLRSLADNAAIALENAILHEEWKQTQVLLRRADRLRSLEAIAGGFAHEVRNPLTSISTFIQLVPSRRNDSYFMDSFGAQVVDDLARIQRLIEEILDYARYMKPKFSAESLNNIVSSCLQFIEVKADKLGISLEKRLAADLPPMLVDRQQIKQVIMNLAMNAIDAMAKTGGRLTVTTRRVVRLDKSGWVQIDVSDTGCGIAPEDLPHIFDPFFTTKHESTNHVGTGLGLSIVHQIIQEHGGTVEARSTVGKGTSFLITLPEGRTQEQTPASSIEWQGQLMTPRRTPSLP
ncbi:MAG TPA: ATP-binding protein, partial [Nitrospira sp.]|nr:ATP-binding protein [Nitrospira sp.]